MAYIIKLDPFLQVAPCFFLSLSLIVLLSSRIRIEAVLSVFGA
jgi:hypothetical protein